MSHSDAAAMRSAVRTAQLSADSFEMVGLVVIERAKHERDV